MENIREKENDNIPEIEGNGYTWYYVCPACHGQVDWHDPECRHCKRGLDWDG